MSVYDPLRDYLQRQTATRFTLRFSEIEKILGTPRVVELSNFVVNSLSAIFAGRDASRQKPTSFYQISTPDLANFDR